MKLKWHFQQGRWTATSEEGRDFVIYPEYGFLRLYHLHYRNLNGTRYVKHSSHRSLGDAKKAAENWGKKEAN